MDTFVSDPLVYRHRGARLFAWREPTFPARFVRFGGVLDSHKTAILGAGPARRAKRPGIVPGPLSRLYGYARCKWALLAHVTAKCGRACEVHLAASSTINGNDRAGHVGTHVARQVDKGIGDVLGLADTTERDGGDERLDDLFGQCGNHVGLSDARGNGVHTDALGGKLARQALREACLLYTSPSPRD